MFADSRAEAGAVCLAVETVPRCTAQLSASVLTTAEDRSLSSDFTNFRKLSMPVAIIWGRTDSVTPLWQGYRLHELIPHSQLVVLNGVGHIPYIEDPPKFTEALRKLTKS